MEAANYPKLVALQSLPAYLKTREAFMYAYSNSQDAAIKRAAALSQIPAGLPEFDQSSLAIMGLAHRRDGSTVKGTSVVPVNNIWSFGIWDLGAEITQLEVDISNNVAGHDVQKIATDSYGIHLQTADDELANCILGGYNTSYDPIYARHDTAATKNLLFATDHEWGPGPVAGTTTYSNYYSAHPITSTTSIVDAHDYLLNAYSLWNTFPDLSGNPNSMRNNFTNAMFLISADLEGPIFRQLLVSDYVDDGTTRKGNTWKGTPYVTVPGLTSSTVVLTRSPENSRPGWYWAVSGNVETGMDLPAGKEVGYFFRTTMRWVVCPSMWSASCLIHA